MKQLIKTTLLLGILSGILVAIGGAVAGKAGMYGALAVAGLMNFSAYWFSDKLVLKTQGAKPLDESQYPQVARLVRELTMQDGMPMPKMYVVDTDVPNAFATGRSPQHAAVAVTTGILKVLNDQELKSVLGHELGHVKNRDILVSTIAATAAGAITLLAQLAQFGGMFMGQSRDGEERGMNPIGMLATIILAPIAATLIQLAISRSREFLADEHGAHLMGDGEALASALQKLDDFKQGHVIQPSQTGQVTAHLMFMNMFSVGGFAGLFSTHPSTAERIARLKEL